MNRRILLVDPDRKSKYPPLGLMKISQYHKGKGDEVHFVRGLSAAKRDEAEWDRVYVSSLFTFNWAQTVGALKFYRYSVKEPCSDNMVVGGVLATLMADDLRQAVGCRVVEGLLDRKGQLGYDDDDQIDSILPDYSILDSDGNAYRLDNAYIAYSTRGCPRGCEFCAVSTIEPHFKHYLPIAEQIKQIDALYGPKRDLLLLDNNVLQSKELEKIITEIKEAGFEVGATLAYKGKNGQTVKARRWADFNQGVDIRLLDEPKMALLSQIALRPLRLAFDDVHLQELYVDKVRLAAKYGIKRLSNYVLFNFKDKPQDLYERLRINIDLNQELGLQIYSFPMRYIDLRSKDRRVDTPGNVGVHWNKKYLRAIQCILHATRGIVSPKKDFFEAAFGRDVDEFKKILMMPEDYIMNREAHRLDGSAAQWWEELGDLTTGEREQLDAVVHTNRLAHITRVDLAEPVRRVLRHYVGEDEQLLLL